LPFVTTATTTIPASGLIADDAAAHTYIDDGSGCTAFPLLLRSTSFLVHLESRCSSPSSSLSLSGSNLSMSSSMQSSSNGKIFDDEETKKPLTEVEDDQVSSPRTNRLRNRQAIASTLIDANVSIVFMTLVTIYVLYGDDARILLAFDPGFDIVFVVLNSIAFVLFFIEIVVLCWCRESYFKTPNLVAMRELFTLDCWAERISTQSWLGEVGTAVSIGSFYFWLDLISTLSMMIDMPWVIALYREYNDAGDQILANASLAGAKAARLMRMVRLVRLVKLYKYISLRQSPMDKFVSGSIPVADERRSLGVPAESHVGAEMSDRTTKRVIVGILIMLLGIPIFLLDSAYYSNEYAMQLTFEQRISLSTNITDASEAKQFEDSELLMIARTTCIDITYTGFNDGLPDDAIIPRNRTIKKKELSVDEMNVQTIGDANFTRSMTAIFDVSARKRDEAFLGVLLTTFIVLLLGFGMVSFTSDVNDLVIIPIEHMMQLVREISENPLGKDISSSVYDKSRNKDDGMETTLLIRTISKIAGLMRVGFGEAGADIIGKSLNFNHGGDGDTINFLGNGRKIHSIFGFCDVRQFTDTTECLQEEVMLFVNRIAHILHSIVVQCDGAANKNIGDAFLITWKVNTNAVTIGCENHTYLGDKALYSFVKTMIEMAKQTDFLCNLSNRAISELYMRMPGYKCRIGCGLHFGWAIEGAIGSSKKIDASYVSPHVNMAETLEASTKEYGVSILMSEEFYNLLSPGAATGCRKVDVIKRREGDPVTSLYTYDIDLTANFANNAKVKSKAKARRTLTFVARPGQTIVAPSGNTESVGSVLQKTRKRLSTYMTSTVEETETVLGAATPTIRISKVTPNSWNTDDDVVLARSHFSDKQRGAWALGMAAYEKGQWGLAREHFNFVLEQSDGKDGPALNLLRRMGEHNYSAPESWQGYCMI